MSKLQVTIDGHEYEVQLNLAAANGAGLTVLVNGEPVQVVIPTPVLPGRPLEWLVVDERPYEVVMDPDLTWIQSASGIHRMMVRDLEAFSGNRLRGGDGRVTAPIPGLIARLFVQPGMMVTVGQPLLVLEAMKMENEIGAPVAGQVLAVHVQPGQTVARKHLLVEIG